MVLTEINTGYAVQFDYNPRIIQALKKIPKEHRRFDPASKKWLVSKDSSDTLMLIAKRFKANFTQSQEPEFIGDLRKLPEPSESIIDFCKHNMKLQPYHYQLQGIEMGMEMKRFINGDEPGLGKSMQSIGTVTALNAFPCLVVCPSTLKENWRREWSDKFTNKRAVVMTDPIKHTWDTFLKVGMVDVFIVNYESLKKYFVKEIKPHPGRKMRLNDIVFKESINLFKSVIYDELHNCKDGSSQQAKYSMGIARGIDVRIGLTGTPIVNKPKDLIAQLHVIGRLMDFGGYKHFVNRYCDGGSGANNLGELHWRLHDMCFFRRNKKDVLKDLPDRVRQVMVCEISTRSEYNNAKNDFVKYLYEVKKCTDAEVAKKLRAMFMVQLGQLKAISAKGKLESVFEWVDEIVESGEKVILFCSLREIGDRVMERYGSTCVAVRGDVTGDARQKSVDSFQKCGQCGVLHQDHKSADHDFVNNEIKVIVCSIKAAGVGLTLTASSRIGFIEFPWTDADCDQCESRAHRNGQEMAVECKYFLGDKTVDSYCYDIIKEKRSIAKMVAGQEDIQEEVIDNLINIFNQ